MTVDELRAQLSSLPGEALVILSSDEEGNRFSPVFEVSTGQRYYPVDGGRSPGEVPHPDDYEEFEEDYEGSECFPAVVLWPTH